MSALDVLLEGFDEGRHPRGPMGRWIATFHHPVHGSTSSPVSARSSKEAWSKAEELGRRSGSVVQNLAPHDEGARAIGRAEDKVRQPGISDPVAVRASMHPAVTRALEGLGDGRWYSSPAGGGHVRRTSEGFEVYPHGSAAPVKTHKTPSAAAGHLLRLGRAPNEQRSDEMASGPLTRVSAASLGRVSAPREISGPSVAVSTKDGRRISLDAARREQTDYQSAHGKPSPFLPDHIKAYTAKDDPHGPVRPRDVNPSRHPVPIPGLPSDATRLQRARERAAVTGRQAPRETTAQEIARKSPGAQGELAAYKGVQSAAGGGSRSKADMAANQADRRAAEAGVAASGGPRAVQQRVNKASSTSAKLAEIPHDHNEYVIGGVKVRRGGLNGRLFVVTTYSGTNRMAMERSFASPGEAATYLDQKRGG